MQNETYKFDHEVFGKLEVVMYEDKPYFIANNVSDILGYKQHKDGRAHCKSLIKLSLPDLRKLDLVLLATNPQGIILCPEKDVYRMIMRSNLPKAEEFQDWVMEEVLPTIRKTGGIVKDVDNFTNTYFEDTSESIKKIVKTSVNKKKSNYYVYKVFIDSQLKYIGKGTGDRYLHASSGTSNNYELNKAHFEGKEIKTQIVEEGLTDYKARKLEKELITTAVSFGITLFNVKGVNKKCLV